MLTNSPLRDPVCFVLFQKQDFSPHAISLIFIDLSAVLEMDWCDSIHWYLLK